MTFTVSEYTGLQEAYDHFNAELFAGKLPQLLITLQRGRKFAGFYCPERFSGRETGEILPELALNPDGFRGRTDLEILSTLVHEQAHHWQQEYGKPSRNGYHNKEWARKMEDIGLMPSRTGMEGGARTGQRMTHYIIPGGAFEMAAEKLRDKGFRLGVEAVPILKLTSKKNKTKYVCPDCGLKAWAKAGVRLVCGECDRALEETEDEPV